MNTIQAVYEDGVFRPIGEVALPEEARLVRAASDRTSTDGCDAGGI